jgi:hypothetical protein
MEYTNCEINNKVGINIELQHKIVKKTSYLEIGHEGLILGLDFAAGSCETYEFDEMYELSVYFTNC